MIRLGRRERERLIRRILIVEDEPLIAFDNEHLLSEAGYEVVATVDSVEAALAVIEAEALDLVMTDIMLRDDGDGREVARVAGSRGVPVLFVTGQEEILVETLAMARLSKPYTDRILHQVLEALDDRLQGRKTRKLPPGLSLFGEEAP